MTVTEFRGALRGRAANAPARTDRGFIIRMDEEHPERGMTLEELRGTFRDEFEILRLLETAEVVYATYEPRREFLVLDCDSDGIRVLMIGRDRIELIGALEFADKSR